MEWGESPNDTAARELEEETGLAAKIGPILGVVSRWITAEESLRGEPGHVIGIVYEGVKPAGRLRTQWAEGTTHGAAWFTLDEVRALPRVALVDLVLDLI